MNVTGLPFSNAQADHTHAYLWPPIFKFLLHAPKDSKPRRVFDLGCGSGAFTHDLSSRGFTVCGVDPSPSGIENARKAYPGLQFEPGSTEEDLAARFGR